MNYVIGSVIAFCFLLFVALPVGFILAVQDSAHHETVTVKEKPDRTIQQNPDGTTNTYAKLVYAKEGVYTNQDSVSMWKFDSSDVYNQIEEGKTYDCLVAGWRFGFFGMYKNLIDCKEKRAGSPNI